MVFPLQLCWRDAKCEFSAPKLGVFMLVLKRVVAAEEMQTFVGEYNKLARMNVHMDYALGCDIFGWINEGKELLGGYSFAKGDAMAWPKLIGNQPEFFKSHTLDRCLEFNLAWAKGSLHASLWQMMKFWIKSSQIICSSYDVDVITFAVDAKRTGLVRMYEAVCEQMIYHGPVEKYPGMSVIVYSVSKKRFQNLAWFTIPIMAKRWFRNLLRSFTKQSQKQYQNSYAR